MNKLVAAGESFDARALRDEYCRQYLAIPLALSRRRVRRVPLRTRRELRFPSSTADAIENVVVDAELRVASADLLGRRDARVDGAGLQLGLALSPLSLFLTLRSTLVSFERASRLTASAFDAYASSEPGCAGNAPGPDD